jgi:hypothetical protein
MAFPGVSLIRGHDGKKKRGITKRVVHSVHIVVLFYLFFYFYWGEKQDTLGRSFGFADRVFCSVDRRLYIYTHSNERFDFLFILAGLLEQFTSPGDI